MYVQQQGDGETEINQSLDPIEARILYRTF